MNVTIAMALICAGCVACGDSVSPGTPTEQSCNRLAPPGKYAHIGMTILGEPDIEDFVTKVGAPPIVYWFWDWMNDEAMEAFKADPSGEPMLSVPDTEFFDFLGRIADRGSIPAIAWGPPVLLWDFNDPELARKLPSIPRILVGDFDNYIRDVAQKLRDYAAPIMLTLSPEYDNLGDVTFGASGYEVFWDVQDLTGQYGNPNDPDGPERVRDTFKHVIGIFQAEGAHNVSWFMYANTGNLVDHLDASPLGWPADQGNNSWWYHPRYYYPGDEYIDWVGKSMHFTTLDQFKRYFEPVYEAFGEVTNRPFFIPEFSFHENRNSRSSLFRELFTDYLPTKQRFKAATFYHSPLDVQLDIRFGIPLGGDSGQFPDEISSWKEVVVDAPYYRHRVTPATSSECR